jgi:hypothetical protein
MTMTKACIIKLITCHGDVLFAAFHLSLKQHLFTFFSTLNYSPLIKVRMKKTQAICKSTGLFVFSYLANLLTNDTMHTPYLMLNDLLRGVCILHPPTRPFLYIFNMHIKI